VRAFDRVCDFHVMTPMQQIVGDYLRPAGVRDLQTIADAKARLDKAYGWLEQQLGSAPLHPGPWATGDTFTLADCAAAPALFHADWVHAIPDTCPKLKAYRARLCTRPSVTSCIDAARPYRPMFPPGAPDRD
jgi:glutathione S-transferase